ncbi:RES family NAD+ phosphorylase [Chloroflexota bacterium]
MAEFKSWRGYRVFEYAVKNENRYILDSASNEFLKTLISTASSRMKTLPKNEILFRAQRGCDLTEGYPPEGIPPEPVPLNKERMKPLRNFAKEGRANPKGIPYLYLSTDKDTAMAEIRPWLAARVSLGEFKTVRKLSLVDCKIGTDQHWVFYFKQPSADKRESAVWMDLGNSFSIPVDPSDGVDDYVPTQIIAEYFKNHRIDGIIYNSSLGNGNNIVLFNINDAELLNCRLFRTQSISFDFKESGNPYFVKSRRTRKKKLSGLGRLIEGIEKRD